MTSTVKRKVEKLEKAVELELNYLLKQPTCPEQIKDVFENSFDKVVSELMDAELVGNIPAIPIITVPYLGIYGLAQMVRRNDDVCRVRLIPEQIADTKESRAPFGLSWAIDVEDGTKTLGKRFDLAEKEIIEANRLSLTTVGILNLGRGDVLSRHNVVATGSRHGDDRVADLWLSEGRPELYWHWADGSLARWGSASCGRYLGL